MGKLNFEEETLEDESEQTQSDQAEAENKKTAVKMTSEDFGELRVARELFKEKMLKLKDIPIVNKATGIVAQVGKPGRNKPLSDKAINKSLENGYTLQQHIEAAMDIKRLFEDAQLAETRDDKNNEENVLSIKYFHCETNVGGEKAIARIMAKEILEFGHRIYTIELQELNKPAEVTGRTDNNPSAGSKDSVQMSQGRRQGRK